MKYCDHDDTKYQRIRDKGNLFGEADGVYYKPMKRKSVSNGNYIEYERKGEQKPLSNILIRSDHI